jgi:hypothetical protein
MNYITTVISNYLNGYIHLYWTGSPTFARSVDVWEGAPLSQKIMEGISFKFT